MTPMTDLAGRTALVTGGASGIGLGVGQALAEQGVRIILADIDEVELAKVASPSETHVMRLDVTDRSEWARVRLEVEKRVGPVDILCQSAGIGPDGRAFAEMDPESFDRLIQINLTGAFNGVRAFAPGMVSRGVGHIINIASMAGLMAIPNLGAYVVSKFGLVGLSETLRLELEPHGVGVTVVCPGQVKTRLAETTRAAGSERPSRLPGAPIQGLVLDPLTVGRMIVQGVRENRALVITHPQSRAGPERRGAAITEAYDWALEAFGP